MRISCVCLLLVLSVFALMACRDSQRGGAEDSGARARELAQRFVIIDTHIDAPYALAENPVDLTVLNEDRHFDYVRAKDGGLNVAFMSVYIPASLQETGGSKEKADELIDVVEGLLVDHPAEFSRVASPDEARGTLASGRVGLAMGMENGSPIEGDLANLRHFYDRGVRYITLTHSEDNHICDSSYSEKRTWKGLSPFGRELVAAMNEIGMMIDVSHITDDAFFQVMELSRAPVIASHSSLRHFTPDWERNMSDELVELLVKNGGVIQINFGTSFLRDDARRQSSEYWKQVSAYRDEHELEDGDEELAAFREEYWKTNERIYGDVSQVVDHIDRVVELAGVDHVGFGSDFDGVGALPAGLNDVSYYPNLIRELLDRGYSEEDVEKICGGNLLRVWSEIDAVARDLQSGR
jgi:membrane dipeptidase